MNPTVNEIFRQLAEQKEAILNLQSAKQREPRPEGDHPGCVRFPQMRPVPFINNMILVPLSGNSSSFGQTIEEATVQYSIDVDNPVYLDRITAGLKRTVSFSEGREDPLVFTHWAPLSSDSLEALCRRYFADTISGQVDILRVCYPISLDFSWSLFVGQEEKKLTSDYLPSTLLFGDNKYRGFKFEVPYLLKKSEALTVKAVPLRTIQSDDQDVEVTFELHFQLHLTKMIPDAEKIIAAQAGM